MWQHRINWKPTKKNKPDTGQWYRLRARKQMATSTQGSQKPLRSAVVGVGDGTGCLRATGVLFLKKGNRLVDSSVAKAIGCF